MRRIAQCWLLFGLLLCASPFAQARGHHAHAGVAPADVAVGELPPEARETWRLIKQGGPFPYPRDGVVFGNYEHALPPLPRGDRYHEYTVKTPGAHNRGARRIVCGRLPECYYTEDHYRTFRRIREESR